MTQSSSEFFNEAYEAFYDAALDDVTARAIVKEEPIEEVSVSEMPHRVEAVAEDYDPELLTKAEITIVDLARSDTTTRVHWQHSMAVIVVNSIEHQGTLNDILVEEFVAAWRIDNNEVDGNRSYKVAQLRKSALEMGLSLAIVDGCCTKAYHILSNENANERDIQ